MFKFDELDGMGRLVMLKKQKEAKTAWKDAHTIIGLIDAFEKDGTQLMNMLQLMGAQKPTIEAILPHVKGVKKLRPAIEKWLVRLDEYIIDLDTRLSDGSKWYNAIDIQKMADSISPED